MGFLDLPVNSKHAAGVAKLPLHHIDPFDRLLVAQAIMEPLRFLTVDVALAECSELVIAVLAMEEMQSFVRGAPRATWSPQVCLRYIELLGK